MSNMYGMVLARYKLMPQIKTKGLSGQPRLACFSSECGHYSIMKGAHWLGLGTESVFDVRFHFFFIIDHFFFVQANQLIG